MRGTSEVARGRRRRRRGESSHILLFKLNYIRMTCPYIVLCGPKNCGGEGYVAQVEVRVKLMIFLSPARRTVTLNTNHKTTFWRLNIAMLSVKKVSIWLIRKRDNN